VKNIKAHDSRVNDLVVAHNANLVTSCSEDGTLSLFNCYSGKSSNYSGEVVRTIRHPTGLAITLAQITTSPLYSVVFYSKDNSTVYVYSINGQMLDHFCEKTGFVYNMAVLRSTDST
jgi:WD40 repeat protein